MLISIISSVFNEEECVELFQAMLSADLIDDSFQMLVGFALALLSEPT